MKRIPPQMALEIMQSLRSTIGDDDTAALILIKVQAKPDNTDWDAEVLHLVVDGARPEALSNIIAGAVAQFCGKLLAGELESTTSRLN